MLTADDRLAIHDLLARYCVLADAWDWESWSRLFEPDGQWLAQSARLHTPADFAAKVERHRTEQPAARRHFISNVVIDDEPELPDHARVRADVMVLSVDAPDAESARISFIATYKDVVRKVEGRWRFKTRRLDKDTILLAAPAHRANFTAGDSRPS